MSAIDVCAWVSFGFDGFAERVSEGGVGAQGVWMQMGASCFILGCIYCFRACMDDCMA